MRCDGLPALTLQRATTLSKAYCLFSTEACISRGMPLCCGRCGWAGLVERGVVFRPNIDHLVIALALGDLTVVLLLLNRQHFLLGSGDDSWLLLRSQHIVNAHRRTGNSSVTETGVHHTVSEHHGVL